MTIAARDTSKIADRRQLAFETLADLRADLATLERAGGTLRTSGNWTAGQNFSHLAAFIEFAYNGYPPELSNPPWFIKAFLRLRKRPMLRGRLPAGVKIPGIKEGTVGADDAPAHSALSRLRTALDRLERSAPTSPNPVFGPLTHEEWIALHLRHAELHLGFVHPS
ncbi:MAG: DUF1569 domain-containing protein [Phycisphaerales bacterium]